jgi:predicted nucleotide-binding protein (sugar kinase/HSP70/actin superfamily)
LINSVAASCLTPPTNQQISKAGIESMVAETCYPVKVAHGHGKEIGGKQIPFHAHPGRHGHSRGIREMGYYCPLVQSSSYMLRAALNLDGTSILDPTLHLKHEPDILAQELLSRSGPSFKVTKKAVKRALRYALERHQHFISDLHQRGRAVLEGRGPAKNPSSW